MIQEYIEAHPTTSNDSLLNKILATGMTNCKNKISDEQVEELRKYIRDAPSLDYQSYWDLADFKLGDFDVKSEAPEEQRSAPIQLTPEERNV